MAETTRRGTVTLSGAEMRALRWAAQTAQWPDDRALLKGILHRACRSRAPDKVCTACHVYIGTSAEGANGKCVNCA